MQAGHITLQTIWKRKAVKDLCFQYIPPVKKNLVVNWLLMGVFGEAHIYLKSKSKESVRWMVGSDLLRLILGMDEYKISSDAKSWGRNKHLYKYLSQFYTFSTADILEYNALWQIICTITREGQFWS